MKKISLYELLFEKKDRCYGIAKRKYKSFPSAYASGAIVRCRKGEIWKDLKEETEELDEEIDEQLDLEEELDEEIESVEEQLDEGTFDKEKKEGLHGWFSRNRGKGWIDCRTGKPCGRQEGEKRKYPACRPTKSACNKVGTRRKKGKKRVSWEKKSD